MENLTHTLIGVLVGETAARSTVTSADGLPPQRRRNFLVTLAAIASNAPDLDLLASLIGRNKLDYLLEHRGYTHTLAGALIIAAVLCATCEIWCRWRRWSLSTQDRLQLAGIAVLSLLLHIAMDFTNNYGVHPLWPFYNGWLYGDTIFIWEPLLWTAAAPLVFLLRTTVARTLVAALLATAIAVCFTSGLVPLPLALLMTLLTVAMLWIGRRAAPQIALLSGIAAWFGVTTAFAISHGIVRQQLQSFVVQRWPAVTVLDYVLTPMPANPVCWDVMLPMIDGNEYVIRHGTWSLLPKLLAATHCPGHDLFRHITAPITAVTDPPQQVVSWLGEIRLPRTQVSELASQNCEAAAFLRFARVPWTLRRGHHWIIGDLRYDREPELGFAELELNDGALRCPSNVPPWIAPRSDLLAQ